MIYTIGLKSSYEKYISEQGVPKKLGRREDYCGGSVWRTYEEAELFAKDGFCVYGVLADWEKDTIRSIDGNWNDLLVDSIIVKLE
jgi:hypothetical protein